MTGLISYTPCRLAGAGHAAGRLGTVSYANTTGLSVAYDLLGRQNSLSFTGPFGRLAAHQVTTSPAGAARAS